MPARFHSYADPPIVGLWDMYWQFSSIDNAQDKFMAQIDVYCSDVFDPFEDLFKFLDAVEAGTQAEIWIDEERSYVLIESWPLNDGKIQLCITSLQEGITSSEDENIQYNFIIDKENFVRSIRKTYATDFLEPIKINEAKGEDREHLWGWDYDDED